MEVLLLNLIFLKFLIYLSLLKLTLPKDNSSEQKKHGISQSLNHNTSFSISSQIMKEFLSSLALAWW